MDLLSSPRLFDHASHDNDRHGHGSPKSNAARQQPRLIDMVVGALVHGLSPWLAPIPFVGLIKTLEP